VVIITNHSNMIVSFTHIGFKRIHYFILHSTELEFHALPHSSDLSSPIYIDHSWYRRMWSRL